MSIAKNPPAGAIIDTTIAPAAIPSRRVAVVLFNLGGPDSPHAIKPFLKNFFMDPLILRVPLPARFILSRLIAHRRTRREAGDSYAALGGASPLLENSRAQAAALEKLLNGTGNATTTYRSFVCMRYWHPLSPAVVRAVAAWDPTHIVLLPLYPQYSTTTTESSFRAWDKACAQAGLKKPTARICCYPTDNGFIAQSAQNVRAVWDRAVAHAAAHNLRAPRLLFSAHGLPEKIIAAGDPYQWQCERGAAAIVNAAGLGDADWTLCYQSRVGPLAWIGPSTDAEIKRAGADRAPVVIYPHAFVSEHVETLVEIEQEYRHLAAVHGVPYFARVETTGTGAAFIGGLAGLVRKLDGHHGTFTTQPTRLCPHNLTACRFGADNKTP